MTVEHVEIRRGAYHDSVALMQVSRSVATVAGVQAAQVAMATDLNLDVLRGMGFTVPTGAGTNDLVVAVHAVDDDALACALAAVETALTSRPIAGHGSGNADADAPSRTTGSGVRAATRSAGSGGSARGATLALVSVPGQHAFTEAMDALDNGAHVMVFSDNVPLAQEIRLKEVAAERGLLVMGPDCGTAVVSGIGLGFANVVTPGPVGLVAASGTGAQQLLCLLDAAGVGVSHCLGVGGRDLSAAVGGRSARRALAMLDEDESTELVVVVSKPPDAGVEAELRAFAATLKTPVQFAVLGAGRDDLTTAARAAVEAVGRPWQQPRAWPAPDAAAGADAGAGDQAAGAARHTVLRGAFSGGTLCDEAMAIAAGAVGPVASNIPLDGAPRLAADLAVGPLEHAFVDFGDDDLTRGRPHPMIDGSLRAQWISQTGAHAGEPGAGVVVLVDVVLGHGAHPDPATELAAAMRVARDTAGSRNVDLALVVSLCGTKGDPQDVRRQAETLGAAGASVYLSNADAARAAVALLASDGGSADDGRSEAR